MGISMTAEDRRRAAEAPERARRAAEEEAARLAAEEEAKNAEAAAIADQAAAPVEEAQDERETQTDDLVQRYGAIQLDKGPAEAARAQQQKILDKLLSYDPNAAAAQAQQKATQSQLAIARSAPGGAGAKQASMFQALQQAPAIASQTASDAVRQQQQNTQMAAQLVSGTRSQDIDQASREADLGVNAANGIAQAVGRDIQLTSEEARFLGQAQLAIQNLKLDWARMSEQEREARVSEELQRLGLKQQADQFAASQELTFKDVVGGIMSLGGAGIQGGFTLAAAGQK